MQPLEELGRSRLLDIAAPNEAAITRLAGAVLLEVHDEWAIAERRYLAEGSMALLDRSPDDGLTKEVDEGKEPAAGVLTGAAEPVAGTHDGPLKVHHSTGHGPPGGSLRPLGLISVGVVEVPTHTPRAACRYRLPEVGS
jgi:hypothetical protein